MYPWKKQIIPAAGAFMLGILLAVWTGGSSADRITAPFIALGSFLRGLSLSSGTGNAGAWALVICLSCLPLSGFLRKKRSRADFLLILCSAEIFAMLYYLVNPTRVSQLLNQIDRETAAKAWALVSAGCVAGTVVCWALLRLIRVLGQKPADIFPAFLFWTAVVYAFLLGFSGVRGIETSVSALVQGNTEENLISSSRNAIILLHILEMIPDLLGVWTVLLAGRLTLALEKEPFAEETVILAEEISRKACRIAAAALLLTVWGNTLQLILFSKLLRVNMKIDMPLLTLVLCAALILLCRYFRRAKEVHDDNSLII